MILLTYFVKLSTVRGQKKMKIQLDDVTGVISFLAGPDSRFVNGQESFDNVFELLFQFMTVIMTVKLNNLRQLQSTEDTLFNKNKTVNFSANKL